MDLRQFLLPTDFAIVRMLLIQAGAAFVLCSSVINSVSLVIKQDYY